MKHIYDWIEEPSTYEGEIEAKKYLNDFCRPAWDKFHDGTDEKLANTEIHCTYNGEVFRLVGASRLGDVWIRKFDEAPYVFYSKRVDVDLVTDWKLISKPSL